MNRTVLYDAHVALGAKMVEFGGWEMPVQYPTGILEEHLRTRKSAGLFDVSHMGRFFVRGQDALAFLQHVLTNNAAALQVGQAQYTMIPNEHGGAVDDAYLYRFVSDEYLLVVNAGNLQKDWQHLTTLAKGFPNLQLTDRSSEIAMISLQGPTSKEILLPLIESGQLPEPKRNSLSIVVIQGVRVMLARTGYTGEPLGFELFVPSETARKFWDLLIARGAGPVGLGARDTLRLEAALPLYGHELGLDEQGDEIPIFACPLARFAVSFSPLKGDFVGCGPLERQHRAFRAILAGDNSLTTDLPRIVMPVALAEKAVARAGAKVFLPDGTTPAGYVTSGNMTPYWLTKGQGLASTQSDERSLRPIGLAMLDSRLRDGAKLKIEVRSRQIDAAVVGFHLRSDAPPYAWPAVYSSEGILPPATPSTEARGVRDLLEKSIQNTIWRQRECINLIPSEQTLSPMARLLSVMDPAFRYAEHKHVKAFKDVDVFYYQGTDFIHQVEALVNQELCRYLGCGQVESRLISGQMANTVVFGAMVDLLNRGTHDEPRRIRMVMNNGIMRGGHLSAQPMGALRDFVARDSDTERPAVVNFPVRQDNPYRIDLAACETLLAEHRPELLILGRSVVLHPEPVAEIRRMLDAHKIKAVLMYDMAHVLGLVGPHFQEPFREGADIVTGSTHKTFFGTQRGAIAADTDLDARFPELWEGIQRRTFPGAVSNHHLGTLLGLLMAVYEMNHFKDAYQKAVVANAKAFARAMKDCGLDVAGDPSVSFTQTHQVVVNVGYGRGPEAARRLEENNIIVNYQAAPSDEGFSAAGSLRLGVSEMTRFGMAERDFATLAQLIRDVVLKGRSVAEEVKAFRRRFLEIQFCFDGKEFDDQMQKLHSLI